MPPRKKSKSSSSSAGKSNAPPPKFGIQHFFLRHSQLSVSPSLNPTPPPPSIPSPPSQNPHDGLALRAEVDAATATATATGASSRLSNPLQPFKFSPGMLIKQSQDEGGEEITWKISPVNERLRAVSNEIPKMMKLSEDSPPAIRHCSQHKKLCHSPGTASKVEKWLSSPTKKASERYGLSVSGASVGKVNASPDLEKENVAADTNDSSASGNSPFQTPPSLSYSNDKFPCAVTCNGASEPKCSRQHKKALLELLDQVEDVISVDDPAAEHMGSCISEAKVRDSNNVSFVVDHVLDKGELSRPQKHASVSSDSYFLVLEVSEKRGSHSTSILQCPCKVLRLLNEHTGAERALYLWDEWFYSIVSPGDSVNVIGEFDEEGKCDVDHENNFVIVHPDVLVAGTRVAASFGCPRRSVLDERLRSSEYSTAALIGTLLHQIFQAGLMNDSPTVDFMEEYARIVIEKNIESLYACGVNESDMKATLSNAIPRMMKWILAFTDSEDSSKSSVDFGSTYGQKKVKLSEVIDIEEMSWAPKYGLKGMIDASVRVTVRSNSNTCSTKIMPLEFKTGKVPTAQSSVEHCAQVILYTLLMSERYLNHVDTGLLYYLQSDQTQGIAVQRSDLVGLIMHRNELANNILKASTNQQLPPMLRVHGGNTETSGLGDVFNKQISHLSIVHCDFLGHWDRLIDLEAREMQLARKEIWRSNGPKHSQSASCLSSMILDLADGLQHQKSHKEKKFIYRFVHKKLCQSKSSVSIEDTKGIQSRPTDDLDCRLKVGDYVVVSSEVSHITVARGILTDIGCFHVSVSLSKRLRLPWSHPSSEVSDLFHEVWRIEKDEFLTSFSVMRFNIMQLFLQNAHSTRLRKMIVDLEAPRFDSGSVLSQDPAISYILSEKSLNNDQRQAILKILTAKDYALILGMPGTGKTSTMVHAVKALLIRGSSILLASYTNSAIDNLLIKLKAQGIDFFRIGRHEATHEEVREHCSSAMDMRSVDQIKAKLDQVKVVATTCLGITSPLLVNRRFDVCIIDEAGQITLPVSLGPLTFASMFVLVGDHYQLPPLVQSTEARERGMGESLFCRLSEAHPQAISALRSQYRMCQGIMELSNALIYGDRLCCGSPEVANGKLELSTSNSRSSWLKEVLEPSKPVIFLDTDMLRAFETRDQGAISNPVEAYIIAEVAEELVNSGVSGKDIGIITPYNSQASLIQRAALTPVEVHTIDKYQGRDKDCILVSFVRSYERPRSCASSLLGDWHRINVALTRAKKKLIMVGSHRTLSEVPLLMLLLKKVGEQSGILKPSGEDIKQKWSQEMFPG